MSISPTHSQSPSHVPVISGEETVEIREFQDTIILSWYVYDDNLKIASIMTQGVSLYEEEFLNSTTFQNRTISKQFDIGSGNYEFIIMVEDYDNNTNAFTTTVIKEGDNLTTLSLPFMNSVIFISSSIMLVCSKKLLNKKSSQYSGQSREQ